MDEKTAWEIFAHTGSVYSYLAYCKVKHEAEESTGFPQEEANADQYRWTGDRGEDSRGK